MTIGDVHVFETWIPDLVRHGDARHAQTQTEYGWSGTDTPVPVRHDNNVALVEVSRFDTSIP